MDALKRDDDKGKGDCLAFDSSRITKGKKEQDLWEDALKKWTHKTEQKDGGTELNLYPLCVSQSASCKHKGLA